MSPAIIGDDIADHNFLMWAYMASDIQSTFPPLLMTSTVVVRTQLETKLVSKDYTSSVSAVFR